MDASYSDARPDIIQDWKTLKGQIKQQKIENIALLKILEKEKLKTQGQKDMVEVCLERVLRMEEKVGMIADNPNYMEDLVDTDRLSPV